MGFCKDPPESAIIIALSGGSSQNPTINHLPVIVILRHYIYITRISTHSPKCGFFGAQLTVCCLFINFFLFVYFSLLSKYVHV